MPRDCERVVVKLEYYLLANLPQEEALAVADHLEGRPMCSEHLRRLEQRFMDVGSGDAMVAGAR